MHLLSSCESLCTGFFIVVIHISDPAALCGVREKLLWRSLAKFASSPKLDECIMAFALSTKIRVVLSSQLPKRLPFSVRR